MHLSILKKNGEERFNSTMHATIKTKCKFIIIFISMLITFSFISSISFRKTLAYADSEAPYETYLGSVVHAKMATCDLTITEPGVVRFEFIPGSTYHNWRLELFDQDGNSLELQKPYIKSGSAFTGYYGVFPGTCKFTFKTNEMHFGPLPSYTYTVNAYFIPSEKYSGNKNTTQNEAIKIAVSEIKSDFLATTFSERWYKLEIDKVSKLALSLSGISLPYKVQSSLSYAIYKEGALETLYSGSTGVSVVSPYYEFKIGVYYIKVYGARITDFTLSICEEHEHIGAWHINVNPTCLNDGMEEFTCTICGYPEEREIEALGHTYSDSGWECTIEPTCTDPGERMRLCERCNEYPEYDTVEALGHLYDDGVLLKTASVISIGQHKFTCKLCGDSFIEEDKNQLWILPVSGIVGIVIVIGLINYIRIWRKRTK